jgi:riboflavin biosynthesis pyrimidine reductase
VDKLFLYYAPKILGEGAVPFAASGDAPGSHVMLLARQVELHQFGEDFAVEGYLKDPYHA